MSADVQKASEDGSSAVTARPIARHGDVKRSVSHPRPPVPPPPTPIPHPHIFKSHISTCLVLSEATVCSPERVRSASSCAFRDPPSASSRASPILLINSVPFPPLLKGARSTAHAARLRGPSTWRGEEDVAIRRRALRVRVLRLSGAPETSVADLPEQGIGKPLVTAQTTRSKPEDTGGEGSPASQDQPEVSRFKSARHTGAAVDRSSTYCCKKGRLYSSKWLQQENAAMFVFCVLAAFNPFKKPTV
ncbi:hypothetical protein ANANG_G00150310 [Anguilla anguilla]|uniref:Uncharacterized protein n=1 Tax=Anguilla anguilla TaxID=7936 RepID=A0A9D3M8B1_ANGAN|nr:hypothetical protein ANANG_G00150310 [Anguilla anguilla]